MSSSIGRLTPSMASLAHGLSLSWQLNASRHFQDKPFSSSVVLWWFALVFHEGRNMRNTLMKTKPKYWQSKLNWNSAQSGRVQPQPVIARKKGETRLQLLLPSLTNQPNNKKTKQPHQNWTGVWTLPWHIHSFIHCNIALNIASIFARALSHQKYCQSSYCLRIQLIVKHHHPRQRSPLQNL